MEHFTTRERGKRETAIEKQECCSRVCVCISCWLPSWIFCLRFVVRPSSCHAGAFQSSSVLPCRGRICEFRNSNKRRVGMRLLIRRKNAIERGARLPRELTSSPQAADAVGWGGVLSCHAQITMAPVLGGNGLTVRRRLSLLLALGGVAGLAAALDALQDGLAVLVELELGDDDLGGVDADGNGLAVGLLAVDALNVDDVLEAVDGGDLALAALVGATDDGNLVVLADGDAAGLDD